MTMTIRNEKGLFTPLKIPIILTHSHFLVLTTFSSLRALCANDAISMMTTPFLGSIVHQSFADQKSNIPELLDKMSEPQVIKLEIDDSEVNMLSPPDLTGEGSSSSSSPTTIDTADENPSPLDSRPSTPASDADENQVEGEEGKPSPKKSPKKKEEKPYSITLISDKSKVKVGPFEYLALSIWLGWFGFYFYFTLLLPFLYYYCKTGLTIVIAILLTSAFYPLDRSKQPEWGWKLAAWIMQSAEKYFQMRLYCEDYDAVNNAFPAILTTEPHDILPVGLCIFSDTIGHFPNHKVRGCLTSACYSIPGMKHIYTWADATDINKETIKRLINEGSTPTICPGGAHEVTFMTNPKSKELVLYLKNRLGMVKIAAEYGIPIIPTFTFNQRNTYDYIVPQWKWLHTLGRKVGFIPLVFFGAGGIPFGQPHSCPLNMVVGKPVYVPKLGTNVPVEELMKYHQQYLDSIKRIFENNKEQFNMSDITLKIQ